MISLTAALNAPTAIVGVAGSGKTFTAKFAVEDLLADHRRVIIIDPTGVWWGLRSGANGAEAGGFPVTIFGGDHADIPIAVDAGAMIAEALAGREVQAVIDTSELTGGEKTRFLTPFLETLYAKNRAALHLVVDEADEIAPQNPMPDERRLSGIFDKIVRRGRVRGFRPLMITQRPAVLHKNVLSQIGTLVAMKLTSPQDRKAIEGWVKGNADEGQAAEVLGSLAKLARGEGWFWAPTAGILERRHFPRIKTFDSSATPETNDATVAPALTAVDVAELRDACSFSDVTNMDPKTNMASDALIRAAEDRGYERGHADGMKEGKAAGIALGITKAQQALLALRVADVAEGEMVVASASMTPAVAVPKAISRPAAPVTTAKPQVQRSGGAEELLRAIGSVPPLVSWEGVAIRAGYAPSGGGFRSARKALIESGYVFEADGLIQLREKRPEQPCRTFGELVDLWESKLGGGPGRMFRIVAEQAADGKGPITISALASQGGYAPTGGGFRAAMKKLRSSGLVEVHGDRYGLSGAFLDAVPFPA